MASHPADFQPLYEVGKKVVFQTKYKPIDVTSSMIPDGRKATVKKVDQSVTNPTKFVYSVELVKDGPLTHGVDEDALAPVRSEILFIQRDGLSEICS